jgi:hypothetical protein
MEECVKEFVEFVSENPPSCIAEFRPVCVGQQNEEETLNACWVGFHIRCSCGGNHYRVIGNADDDGVMGSGALLSPLSLVCVDCSRESLLFDIEQHGYNAALGYCDDTQEEGESVEFDCKKCGHSSFSVLVSFLYTSESFDGGEGEEDDKIEDKGGQFRKAAQRAKDQFQAFALMGTCRSCGCEANIAECDCD